MFNRGIVGVSLMVALPVVAAAERVRRGGGRTVAIRAIGTVARLCGVHLTFEGGSGLSSTCGYVFVPNHSCPLDIPAVLVARPDVRFVAAAELCRVPLLAAAMRAPGTIPVGRRDPKAARRQLARLGDGPAPARRVVFAEGGIAPAGRRLPFKSGAFDLAIATGASVVPIAIHGAGVVLPPGARLGVAAGTVRVEMLEPIDTGGLLATDRKRLRDESEAVLAALGR